MEKTTPANSLPSITGLGQRSSVSWQGLIRRRVMISRDCGDDVDLNCLELCLPLDSNVASDQPDEAVQRVGGSHRGIPV